MSFLEKLKPVDSSFFSKLKPVRQGPFTFDDVEEAPGERESKIARYQQEAQQAEEESRKANSFMGKLGNFGKAFVGTIANSEVGLGESIAKIMNVDSKSTEGLLKAQELNATTKANLLKRIREKEARGEDATRLKQEYNRLVKDPTNKEVDRLLTEATTMPETSTVVGQMGGTALDLLSAGTYGRATQAMTTGQRFVQGGSKVKGVATASGLPELGQLATQQAGGLFTRQGARNIGIGTGIGYTADVTQGLQGARGEDRTGAQAFIPGAGTVIGFGIPFLSESAQSIRNVRNPDLKAQTLADKRYGELEKLDSYQTLKKATEKGRERGIDIKRVLAETDVLHGSVDKTGTITTKGDGGAVEQYTKMFIDGNEDLVSDLLKKEGASVSPDLVKLKLERAVMDAGIEGSALTNARNKIAQELEGYALRAGDNGVIPVETLHRAKIDKYNSINFFTEGATKKYDKTIANALKELVEENTKSVNVKMINEELSKHFAVIDYLNKLDNKKVSGGKLGKYFAETVGAIVGSHFGPVGAIVGAEAGGRLKGGLMARAFNGKTGRAIPQADVITDAQRVLNEPPKALPQSNRSGNLNQSQSNTIAPTNNSIPPSVLPQAKASSAVSPLGSAYPAPRSALHQKIVNDIKESGSWTGKADDGADMFGGPVKYERRLDIVVGPPASGKSEVLANPLSKKHGAIIADADRVKAGLPEYNGANADKVHQESSDVVEGALLTSLFKDGANVVLPIVGKTPATVESLAKLAKDAGYKVNLTLNHVPSDVALSRAQARAQKTGRVVPDDYIKNQVANKPLENYLAFRNRTDLFDSFTGFSNDVKKGAGLDTFDTSDASYVFSSPNVKTGLQYDDAVKVLKSEDHLKAVEQYKSIDREMNIPVASHSAIGKWTDGAENTIYYKDGDISKDDLIYNAVRKGLGDGTPEGAQKQVIWFKQKSGAGDWIHEVQFKDADPKEVSEYMSEIGIPFQTVSNDRVIIFNKSGEYFDTDMFKKIEKVQEKFGNKITKIEDYEGEGDFIGSWLDGDIEARQEAVNIYNDIIKAYENRKRSQS